MHPSEEKPCLICTPSSKSFILAWNWGNEIYFDDPLDGSSRVVGVPILSVIPIFTPTHNDLHGWIPCKDSLPIATGDYEESNIVLVYDSVTTCLDQLPTL